MIREVNVRYNGALELIPAAMYEQALPEGPSIFQDIFGA